MGVPQPAEPAKAKKLEAPKAEAPIVSIRATSADLGLDYALTIPVTEQRVENFSLLLFDLASGINAGHVLDMQQEVGMKTFEARLSRNLWNREAQQKFYTELGKVYEQQALKMHEMRLSYYRELDHLRDQLGVKARDRSFTMMEDVHFFNPEAYRIPAWREIAELLEVERRPAGPNEKHVRYVPVHVLCKACRAKFTDGIILEPKEAAVQVSETMLQEECHCCPGEDEDCQEDPLASSPPSRGISRWAQTEMSMAKETQVESHASQTDLSITPRSYSPPPLPADEAEAEGIHTGEETDPLQDPPWQQLETTSDDEATPQASSPNRGSTSAAPRRVHSRGSVHSQEAFDLVFDDFEAALDPEPEPSFAAPRRRRRSEPWARPGRQRQGQTSLLDVPDVPPVSTDSSGSDAEGILEPEEIPASCPDASHEEGGEEMEEDATDSETESLGLPLTLEEGLQDSLPQIANPFTLSEELLGLHACAASGPSQLASPVVDDGTETGCEGPTRSRSSVLAASQIEIKLNDSQSLELREARSQRMRGGPPQQGPASADQNASGMFPWEAREAGSKPPNTLRSPRRRPTLEPAAPGVRRDSRQAELGSLPSKEPVRARRNSSKEVRASDIFKDADGCASCPLSGSRRPSRGEQQVPIRSFNFEVTDATSSASLEDTRKPSPRTFLPRVQLPKAKELETKAFVEAMDRSAPVAADPPHSERSVSPVGSHDRSVSPCVLPSNIPMPVRPAGPQSARSRSKRMSLTVPCGRQPATSMSLLNGELTDSPRAPQHKGHSTSLDPCASGPVESAASGDEAASATPNLSDQLATTAPALPMASRSRQRFPSLLTASTTRPKTEQSDM